MPRVPNPGNVSPLDDPVPDALEQGDTRRPRHFVHYNFYRVHSCLRVTPAMAAGITSTVWPLTALVN